MAPFVDNNVNSLGLQNLTLDLPAARPSLPASQGADYTSSVVGSHRPQRQLSFQPETPQTTMKPLPLSRMSNFDIFSTMDYYSSSSNPSASTSVSGSSSEGSLDGDRTGFVSNRHNKTKTVLCMYYGTEKGCSRGDRCSFAHGMEELVKINHNNNSNNNDNDDSLLATEEEMRLGNLTPNKGNRKTKLCRNHLGFKEDKDGNLVKGFCNFAVNCNFAHDASELPTSKRIELDGHSDLYKTQMCKHFQKGTKCWLMEKCNFAHSEEELREARARRAAKRAVKK